MDVNPEYILMKELRKRYRKKYRFLNISIDRHKNLYMKVQQNSANLRTLRGLIATK